MNLNTGTLHALYYGRNATHKDYSAVTSNDLNACEVSLGDHTLGNNIVKSASAIPVVNGSDNPKIPMENWTQVYSMGYFDKEDVDLGRENINYLFSRSANLIIKRLCQNCADSHREIYYRYFANPSKIDLYEELMYKWMGTSQLRDKSYTNQEQRQYFSFNLYSTYLEAYLDTNAWNACSGGKRHVGFPGFCGKTEPSNSQWTEASTTRGGVSYYVDNVIEPTTKLYIYDNNDFTEFFAEPVEMMNKTVTSYAGVRFDNIIGLSIVNSVFIYYKGGTNSYDMTIILCEHVRSGYSLIPMHSISVNTQSFTIGWNKIIVNWEVDNAYEISYIIAHSFSDRDTYMASRDPSISNSNSYYGFTNTSTDDCFDGPMMQQILQEAGEYERYYLF